MPLPRSMTAISASPGSAAKPAVTSMRRISAWSIASTAFLSRFSSTCSIRMGSAYSGGRAGSTVATMAMRFLAASISAKPMASSITRAASALRRRGSERFTNSRILRMILPARCAWLEVFSSAGSSSSDGSGPFCRRLSTPWL